jgi:hypothetical protein
MFGSRYMPCPDCGESIDRRESADHVCDEERRLDYQLFQLREEVAALEVELSGWLASARGRFEAFYAERERRLRGGLAGT